MRDICAVKQSRSILSDMASLTFKTFLRLARLILVACLVPLAVHADRISLSEALDSMPGVSYKPSSRATNPVLAELECIRQFAGPEQAMIRSNKAWRLAEKIAPELESAFNDFKFTGKERALFYSQVLAETGGLTQLSETKNFDDASSGMNQMFSNIVNEPQFGGASGAKASANLGEFRGRGLVQITRCDNIVSTLHFINLRERHRPPVWKSDWKYKVGAEEFQIGSFCTPEQKKAFGADYRQRFGMDANLYNALHEPGRLAMTDAVWQDPISLRKISSERLLVHASMAYWRGRCGRWVDNSLSPEMLNGFDLCKKFAGGSYMDHVSKCLTYCVRGTVDGWQERRRWMDLAQMCARGGVLANGTPNTPPSEASKAPAPR